MKTFNVYEPATDRLLAELPAASAADVEQVAERAERALPLWSGMSGRDRGRLLVSIADQLEQRRGELADLESRDNGRPIRETRAQAGIVGNWYRYFGGLADKIEGRTIPVDGQYLNYTVRVPVGVCGAITPWNHPQMIVAKKIAPALAAGNCVIVKPSELAPLSVVALGRLAEEVGLPPGVLTVVTGDAETGAALAENPRVARVDFTGSTATGIAVAKLGAPTMKRLGMELGGKAANVVFADAEFERTVRGVAFSGFVAQGQSCVAGSLALVHESLAERFAQRLAEYAQSIRVGNPLDESTQMGPLISKHAADRVRAMIATALDQGARRLTGADSVRLPPGLAAANFVPPTVLWNDELSIDITREEVFGPTVVVVPFRSEDEAIELANSTRYGLGAALWSRDLSRSHRVASRVRAGVIWMNDYHRIDPASPWGGFGLSGYGRENGIEVLESFTEVKSVWVPLTENPMDWYESIEQKRLN